MLRKSTYSQIFLFAALAMLFPLTVDATTIASVKLENLFSQADQVVLVKIVAADDEHYETAVYKAQVELAYKGAASGETIYFGPFVGYALGNEYLLFLRTGAGERANKNEGLSFGDITSVSRVMYEGYSSLAVGYECVFDGKDVEQQCDYSVQLNPEQVILPESIPMFPKGDADAITNYKKWVRKNIFLSYLDDIAKAAHK
jgi:hypothetical protein